MGKTSLYRVLTAAVFAGILILLNLTPVQALEGLSLTGKTPGDGGSLGGIQGEISLTFNQPVEVFDKNGQPQIFFLIDEDGDGKGDDIVEGGNAGGFRGILAVSDTDPNKVIFRINDRLSPDKNYILIVNSVIRVKGSSATDPKKSNQVFEGISMPQNMTGWSFNTKTAQNTPDNTGQQQETVSFEQGETQKETEIQTPSSELKEEGDDLQTDTQAQTEEQAQEGEKKENYLPFLISGIIILAAAGTGAGIFYKKKKSSK